MSTNKKKRRQPESVSLAVVSVLLWRETSRKEKWSRAICSLTLLVLMLYQQSHMATLRSTLVSCNSGALQLCNLSSLTGSHSQACAALCINHIGPIVPNRFWNPLEMKTYWKAPRKNETEHFTTPLRLSIAVLIQLFQCAVCACKRHIPSLTSDGAVYYKSLPDQVLPCFHTYTVM